MSFDVEQYLHYKIANAPILTHPYPHFYITDIFPPDSYAELVATFPERTRYKRLDETGTVPKGAYPERFICELEQARAAELENAKAPGDWGELSRIFQGEAFAQLVLSRFYAGVVERFGADVELAIETDCRLVRDFSNYAIPPHTDSPSKLVSLLFYMPPDESMRDLGTSMYVPIDPNLRCEGRAHHDFESFRKVMTAPYLPNSLFGFFKTDRAFHGVERIERTGIRRDSILYNIYVRKVLSRAAAPQSGPAPASPGGK
jgi:hypothetical protein